MSIFSITCLSYFPSLSSPRPSFSAFFSPSLPVHPPPSCWLRGTGVVSCTTAFQSLVAPILLSWLEPSESRHAQLVRHPGFWTAKIPNSRATGEHCVLESWGDSMSCFNYLFSTILADLFIYFLRERDSSSVINSYGNASRLNFEFNEQKRNTQVFLCTCGTTFFIFIFLLIHIEMIGFIQSESLNICSRF